MVVTLIFPGSLSDTFPHNAPLAQDVTIPDNSSARSIPSTGNPLYPLSQDTALAFSVPYSEASNFLSSVQELPNGAASIVNDDQYSQRPTTWVIKAAKDREHMNHSTFRNSARNAWTEFVDLIKVSVRSWM